MQYVVLFTDFIIYHQNEQCPEADASDDCADMTSGTGACYDPEISAACSRTCCETYREDLNADCRYGDKVNSKLVLFMG